MTIITKKVLEKKLAQTEQKYLVYLSYIYHVVILRLYLLKHNDLVRWTTGPSFLPSSLNFFSHIRDVFFHKYFRYRIRVYIRLFFRIMALVSQVPTTQFQDIQHNLQIFRNIQVLMFLDFQSLTFSIWYNLLLLVSLYSLFFVVGLLLVCSYIQN